MTIRGESLSYWGYSRAINDIPHAGGSRCVDQATPPIRGSPFQSNPPFKYKLFILTIVLVSYMPLVGMWEVAIGPLMDLLYNKLFNITW
jgi:hypothetical protein